MRGVVIFAFEALLLSKSFIEDFTSSCSSSQVGLLALKNIIMNELRQCDWILDSSHKCDECGNKMHENFVPSLLSTFFNVAANNFAKLLNCKQMANKISLKMVKDMKNKNRHVSKSACDANNVNSIET